MGDLSKQIFIKAPLEKVWAIWLDVENTAAWVDGVQESRLTSTVREGRGLSWCEKCLVDEKIIEMNHDVVEWETAARVVVKTGLPMGATMRRVVEFSENGGLTEVRIEMAWDLGMIGMFYPEEKIGAMFEKSLNRTADRWKDLAEQTPA